MKKLKVGEIYRTRGNLVVRVKEVYYFPDGEIKAYVVTIMEYFSNPNLIGEYYRVNPNGAFYLAGPSCKYDVLIEEDKYDFKLPSKKKNLKLKKNFSLGELMEFE